MFETPHRRYNPLNGEWVLVSPQRARRPWLGEVNKRPPDSLPAYDPSCYLCPGNERAGGKTNPDYQGTYIFDNDFAALLPSSQEKANGSHPLFSTEPETGICRVICFSPRHDLSIPCLSLEEVNKVVGLWCRQTAEFYQEQRFKYVQIFENKGAMMGCSNPHPHCQIWAQTHIPNEPAKELKNQQGYYEKYKRPLLLDYLEEEQKRGERLVVSNRHFSALVPFWAVWPFELLILPHRQVSSLIELNPDEQNALADIYRQVTTRYDNLFEISFPYSMGYHQAPNDGKEHPEWTLHSHFYPPLLRSATIKKFMVGYEILAMPQRDISAESAALRLRELPAQHYSRREK